jgi:hypothetical protein
MDPQELERAQAWFERWGHKPCPVCSTYAWRMQHQLGQVERLPPGPFGAGTEPEGRWPLLLVTCQTCGYLLTINAIDAGIRQPPFN